MSTWNRHKSANFPQINDSNSFIDETKTKFQAAIDSLPSKIIPDDQKDDLFDNLIEIAQKYAIELSNLNYEGNYFNPNQIQGNNLYIPCMPLIPPPMMYPVAISSYHPYYQFQYPNYLPPLQFNDSQKSKKHHKKCKKEKKSESDTKASDQKVTPTFTLVFEKKTGAGPFNGIFSELTKRNSQININDSGIIKIRGNSRSVLSSTKNWHYGTFSSIVNYNYKGDCYGSRDEPNSFLTFDFKKNNRIALSAYSIQSTNFTNGSFLLSWVIEGSDDNLNWVFIDERKNQRELKEMNSVKTFEVSNQEMRERKFRYIRLRATEARTNTFDPTNRFTLKFVEMFGKYYKVC